jgi:hypothetical protein
VIGLLISSLAAATEVDLAALVKPDPGGQRAASILSAYENAGALVRKNAAVFSSGPSVPPCLLDSGPAALGMLYLALTEDSIERDATADISRSSIFSSPPVLPFSRL